MTSKSRSARPTRLMWAKIKKTAQNHWRSVIAGLCSTYDSTGINQVSQYMLDTINKLETKSDLSKENDVPAHRCRASASVLQGLRGRNGTSQTAVLDPADTENTGMKHPGQDL